MLSEFDMSSSRIPQVFFNTFAGTLLCLLRDVNHIRRDVSYDDETRRTFNASNGFRTSVLRLSRKASRAIVSV